MVALSRTQYDILARARRAAKAAARGNLVINPQASSTTITAPAALPSTTGFTNQLSVSQGWVASFTGNTTSGSNVITGISSMTGLAIGQYVVENSASNAVYPANVPLGAVITAIDAANSTVTISKAATATASTVALRVSSNRFRTRGGVPISFGNNFTVGGATVGNSVTPPTAQRVSAHAYAIEFMTDVANVSTAAATIMFYVFQNSASPYSFRVAVDDVYQHAPLAFDATGRCGTIQFSTAGIKKVRIELPAGLALQQLWIANGGTIWAPESADELLVGWFSDSFGSSGLSGSWPMRNMAHVAGHLLGWQVDAISVAGTGYRSDGSTNYNWQSAFRQRDVLLRDYDMIVFFGSINDSAATSEQERAAALATWQAVRAVYPSKPIIILGVPTTVTVSAATATTLETGLALAFADWADANSAFIPITNASDSAWISTANTAVNIGADNNHPSDPTGAAYLGYRAASAIAKVIDNAGELLAA